MKNIFIAIFLALQLLAQDSQESIDKEIEKIFQSPPTQRRELMNELKLRIRNLNQDRQLEAIEKIKEHMIQLRKRDNSKKAETYNFNKHKKFEENFNKAKKDKNSIQTKYNKHKEYEKYIKGINWTKPFFSLWFYLFL